MTAKKKARQLAFSRTREIARDLSKLRARLTGASMVQGVKLGGVELNEAANLVGKALDMLDEAIDTIDVRG